METIDLEKVVHKELMIINSEASSKKEVLENLSDLLLQHEYISDKSQFLIDLYDREAEGETGIGQGIAIPHGKSKAVLNTTVAVAILNNEIEWETLDGKGVNVVIMFAVKDSDINTTHILLLQKIAVLLAKDTFTEDIKKVSSVEEVYDLFMNN
ncbi:fructose-specific PTS system IIA component [Vagococcus lutrae]|uniref:PTS sugar transporter subunit IIA n=1 Tax=Vagococcus lutrae TaxID=81947 RepID=UPI001928FED9|nr:fructose PTS transporter subunit IIA [Vagococcus lutrae]MDT2818083.1 fructose PTS transporter subunit IIA [Vagococcus lutrae]GEQ62515.1 fructose-specific PTS system IIA component [Vagococcus lutrae]GEQ64410.1 fructose-specific PTS system IIA component [Vagococcus lutrae]GEQ66301.1 fructose-specific PTS system IIA component [Vagococcus lutrae]